MHVHPLAGARPASVRGLAGAPASSGAAGSGRRARPRRPERPSLSIVSIVITTSQVQPCSRHALSARSWASCSRSSIRSARRPCCGSSRSRRAGRCTPAVSASPSSVPSGASLRTTSIASAIRTRAGLLHRLDPFLAASAPLVHQRHERGLFLAGQPGPLDRKLKLRHPPRPVAPGQARHRGRDRSYLPLSP